MTNERSVPHTRAYEGDETPMHPEEATVDPLSAELGLKPEIVSQHAGDRTVADGELPVEERRAHNIEDNVRHSTSIGRR